MFFRISKIRGMLYNNNYYSCYSTFEAKCNEFVVNETEKVTPFLNMRGLLSDEISNLAVNIRKLIGTSHPLIAISRHLVMTNQTPTLGSIVLLVSKAGGLNKEYTEIDRDVTTGVLHSQRLLAKNIEMVRSSNIIHKHMLNLKNADRKNSDLNNRNKVLLLTGDYLLSKSHHELASLRNQDVTELFFTCLRDLTEAEFIQPRDKQNNPLPAKPLDTHTDVYVPNEFGSEPFKIKDFLGNAKAEWTLRHFLSNASMLAKSCHATLKIAEHPEEFQKSGYLFGRNIALTWQANKDLEIFEPGTSGNFSLVCAPLLFHLQFDPSFYDTLMAEVDMNEVDFENIRRVVKSGPGLEKTVELQKEFSQNCFEALECFPNNDAKTALINILNLL